MSGPERRPERDPIDLGLRSGRERIDAGCRKTRFEIGRLAAEACFAADAQGKFWELHDIMFANQEDLSRDAIVGYAKQAGLDATKIANALDHHTYADALAQDVSAGKEIGVRATPEFLINGKDFTGARPVEDFRAAIDAALADAP